MDTKSAELGTFDAEAAALRVRSLEDELHAGLRRSVEVAAQIGDLLEEAKHRLPHGEYEKWLRKVGVTKSSAHRYRCVAKHVREGQAPTGHMTVSQFLGFMRGAAPSVQPDCTQALSGPRPESKGTPPREPQPAPPPGPSRLPSPTDPSARWSELEIEDVQVATFLSGHPVVIDGQQVRFDPTANTVSLEQGAVWLVYGVRLELQRHSADSAQ